MQLEPGKQERGRGIRKRVLDNCQYTIVDLLISAAQHPIGYKQHPLIGRLELISPNAAMRPPPRAWSWEPPSKSAHGLQSGVVIGPT
jgi:hypothetical protein